MSNLSVSHTHSTHGTYSIKCYYNQHENKIIKNYIL